MKHIKLFEAFNNPNSDEERWNYDVAHENPTRRELFLKNMEGVLGKQEMEELKKKCGEDKSKYTYDKLSKYGKDSVRDMYADIDEG